MALRLAELGYTPIITYLTHKTEADNLAKDISSRFSIQPLTVKLDVRNEESVKQLALTIKEQLGGLDLLVCNAGTDYLHKNFDEITLEEWHEIYETKVFGSFLTIQHLLPLLEKSADGHIVTISASLADKPDPLDPVYSSACAALNNFTRSMVYSLGPRNIRSNILCPGPQDTNLAYWQDLKQSIPDIFASFVEQSPLKKPVTVTEIADALYALDSNSSLNGNTIFVTGGSHLR